MAGTEGILKVRDASSAIGYLPLELDLDSEVLLIQHAVKRDRAAFTTLYDMNIDRVYKFVFYWLPSQADAEDITQEVFVRAWHSIDKYKVSGVPFIAWLITIARNLVNSHYRTVKKFIPLDDIEPADDADPQAEAETNYIRGYVRDAIMKLKDDKRAVIQMRFISEMSYEEVAKAMNKTEGTVRVLQYRALKDLKKILETTNR